jgi:hypothetical protein
MQIKPGPQVGEQQNSSKKIKEIKKERLAYRQYSYQ